MNPNQHVPFVPFRTISRKKATKNIDVLKSNIHTSLSGDMGKLFAQSTSPKQSQAIKQLNSSLEFMDELFKWSDLGMEEGVLGEDHFCKLLELLHKFNIISGQPGE